jgi:hypothetical protein
MAGGSGPLFNGVASAMFHAQIKTLRLAAKPSRKSIEPSREMRPCGAPRACRFLHPPDLPTGEHRRVARVRWCQCLPAAGEHLSCAGGRNDESDTAIELACGGPAAAGGRCQRRCSRRGQDRFVRRRPGGPRPGGHWPIATHRDCCARRRSCGSVQSRNVRRLPFPDGAAAPPIS